MMTLLLDSAEIKKGASLIMAGGIVAFPTETVYGLGADATNKAAVEKIFTAKGRPSQNPLIVHFESLEDLFVRFPDLDANTKSVLTKIPDALTVIVPRPSWIPSIVSAGLDTVACRVPSCEFARTFIKACKTPIAAPSANTSSRPSPTRWQHVYVDLKNKIDAVFTSDPARIGVESTVIRVLKDKIQVLRLGGTSTAQLSEILPVEIVCGTQAKASPGTHFKHYAPTCKMVIARYGPDMTQRIQKYIKNKKASVIFWQGQAEDYIHTPQDERNTTSATQSLAQQNIVFLGRTPEEITHNLYTSIRSAEWGSDIIVCEGFPNTSEYETLNERAHRASDGNYI